MTIEPSPVRLLMVEFAVINRFHRTMSFPHVQGFARQQGAQVRWLRFAVPPDVSLALGSDETSLPPKDRAALRVQVREFKPSHVLFASRPASALAAATGPRGRGPRCAYFIGTGTQSVKTADGDLLPLSTEDGILAFLGFERPAQAQGTVPDYSWTPGNPAAKTLDPLPFVIVDVECRHKKSIARNPFFTCVDLSGNIRPGGCSFCMRPTAPQGHRKALEALMERQLSAIEKTCPRLPGRRLAIRLTGELVMDRADDIAAVIARLKMSPADFLLDCRVDSLVNRSARFEKALGRLKGTGHRFSLSLIGIENFSSSELPRYNKGISPSQNLEAVQRLFEWEARFPCVFNFTERGRLSMITFNPWTRPEEFDLNIAVAELTGIASMVENIWNSRLRLYPRLPLQAKAREDGLLIKRYDDPLLETARRNFDENEIPWRFQSPAMEDINRIVTLFFLEGAPPEGALSTAVAAFLKEGLSLGIPHTMAAHLVVLSAQREAWKNKTAGPMRVLARAKALARSYPLQNSDNVDYIRPDSFSNKRALSLLEHKPVAKIEPVDADDLKAWRAREDMPNAEFNQRTWVDPKKPPVWEIFYGRKAAEVRRAVTMSLRQTSHSKPDSTSATSSVGVLLGYPKCCAKAYAALPTPIRHWYFWGHVANRISKPGPVPWELNPALGAIQHVPCSLDCRRSLAQARRMLSDARHPASRRSPFLMLWGSDNHGIELIPRTAPSMRFGYRAGAFIEKGPDLDAIRQGTEIEFGPETILIRKGGRPFASLSGRAFLWWDQKIFQADFWRAMFSLRAAVPEQESIPSPAKPEALSIDARALAEVLAAVDADCARGASGALNSRFNGDVIEISCAGKQVGLFLAPRKSYTGPFFAEMPSFFACIRGDAKMAPSQGETIKAYADALARRDKELKAIFQA